MKKIAAAITIAVMLAIAPSVMAGGIKVPKNLCLLFNGPLNGDYHQLSFKSIGTVIEPEGKIKMYAITGITTIEPDETVVKFPVNGTAYIIPGTNRMHASYGGMSGVNNIDDERRLCSYETDFDLVTGEGPIQYRYDVKGGNDRDNDTAWDIDCDDMYEYLSGN